MANKLTVIVDGNYHLHKSLHVYGHYCKGPLLGSQKDKEMFMRKIATDMAFAVRQLGKPDRLIFTVDESSWRKNVEIEENKGYKANRIKDETTVDWTVFNDVMKEFTEILKGYGCIISKINGCEGDDLMFYWAEKLFNDGEDVVIITGDGDINQLVRHNDQNFVVVYNIKSTNRKIVAANGFSKFLEDDTVSLLDAFSFMGNNKDVIKKVISASALEEINPMDVIFEKVLMGDGGDNVPPIISWEEKQKNDKIVTRKLTSTKAQRIRELLEGRGIVVDPIHLYDNAKDIEREIKIIYDKTLPANIAKEFTTEVAEKRIRRNTILVYLSDETIPIMYREAFEKHYEGLKESGYPRISKWDMYTLLEKTDYIQAPTAFEADVFKNLGGKSKIPVMKSSESKSLF